MAEPPKGLEIIMGASKKGAPADDDEPPKEGDADDVDACSDVWDAVQAKDEAGFCAALKAAIQAYATKGE